MSQSHTLPPLRRIPREELSSLLLDPSTAPTISIIDVRGEDHVGGHIRGSINIPSTSLDYRIPEIVRTLADKEKVVFHCALSQERGPKAARAYMEEKLRKGGKIGDFSWEKEGKNDGGPKATLKKQEVYVLDRGFVGWQEKYGNDEKLTEAYAPEIWADY